MDHIRFIARRAQHPATASAPGARPEPPGAGSGRPAKGHRRDFRFGSSAYLVEGFGTTSASFAHDYKVLLRTFRPRHR